MNIKINDDACIGCGRCTEICPKTFRLNNDTMKAEVVSDDNSECVYKAADQCPTDAILVDNEK